MVEQPDWAASVNLDSPSPARVYDYFLGGSHNFEVDRQMAARLQQAMPDIGEIMRANRSFLRRAVRYLVEIGVRQFLDLGSGIPTVGNVHEIAQKAAPDAKVVYVDVDPVAVAHSTVVLADNPRTAVVTADLRQPEQVLRDPLLTALLDLSRPVAVLLVGVLHQIRDADLAALIAFYRSVMAPGSYLVMSQATADSRPAELKAFQNTYNRGYGPGIDMTLRTRDQVLALFDGFELVEPGLVQLPEWRPETPDEVGDDPVRFSTYAAIGRLA
jgi:SAM-dependent methyltransferase